MKARASKAPTFEGFGRVVPGEGPRPAAIAICGEAPGFNEDQTGRPFVGPAGRLLNTCLERAGLCRADIYITNAIKRRPPDNRKPKPAEIKSVREDLAVELAEVAPTVVVAMGDAALQALTSKKGITKHRGVEVDGHLFRVLPTFHPAYALRNPSITTTIIKDLRRAKVLAEGKPADEIEVQIVRDMGDITPRLRGMKLDAEVVAYDVETTGLDPLNPDHEMLAVGLTVEPSRGYYFLPEAWPFAQKILASAKKAVAHNGKFDNRWLARYGITVNQTFDTMLAAYVLDENRSTYKLERLAVEVLGVDPYHEATDADLTAGKGAEIPVEALAARCVRDVCYTLRLYRHQREEIIKDTGLRRVFQHLMMPSSRLAERVEGTGLPLDMGLLAERHDLLVEAMKQHEAAMQEIIGDEDVNLKSTKQLGALLYGRLGLPVLQRTPKGAPSTKNEVLVMMRDQHPFLQHLIDYRKCAKYQGSYFERWRSRAVVQLEDTGSGAGKRGAYGDRPFMGNAREVLRPYPSPDQP